MNALLGYEPTDEDALLLHLRKVIGDSSVRNQLSSAALKAVTGYTWASVGSSWYLAIEKAKEQKKSGIRWIEYGQ